MILFFISTDLKTEIFIYVCRKAGGEMKSNAIHIKNMVCNRCIMVVTDVFKKMGLTPLSVELGIVILQEPIDKEERDVIKSVLEGYGFELIDDKRMRIIEQIKVAIIELVHHNDNLSKINY